MQLVTLAWIWVPLLIGFFFFRSVQKAAGVGLVIAYLVGFCGLHWTGGLIRLLPWFQTDIVLTTYGLEQGTYALAALIAGSLLIAPLIASYLPTRRAGVYFANHPRLPQAYLAIGVGSYFLLSTPLGGLPSMTVLLATGQQFLVLGLCLFCWNKIRTKQTGGLLIGLAITATLPLLTIVMQGFMGYGAAAALLILAFIGSIFERWKMLLLAVLTGYIGLSVYVTYMRDRQEIRDLVWGNQPLQVRVAKITEGAINFEWFDLSKASHLTRVDSRMNQNLLVGAAVDRLSYFHDFANGATIWDALLALVPRALWPEKTIVAGSGNLVSRYTGMRFAEGTSIGVGQVLEFYINFGTAGVVIGFLVLGCLITIIDGVAQQRLLAGDHQAFALWFLTGMSLLQSGGSLVEITASAAGALLVATIANRYFLSHMQKKYFVPAVPIQTLATPK